MAPFLVVGELVTGQRERFAVMAIDPSQREGTGCKAWVRSLHMTRDEAECAIRVTQGGDE